MLDDETLKRLWSARDPGADHPDETTWERLMCDELAPAERAATLAHVTSCAGCARIYKALLRLDEEAREADPTLPGRVPPVATRRPWIWGGLAAAATLVVGSWITLSDVPQPSATPATFRSASSVRVEPLEPTSVVTETPTALSWRTDAKARGFRVRLFDAEGGVVWSSGPLDGPRAELPPGLRLEPGPYLWDVTVVLEDGREVESAPFGFTLSAPEGAEETRAPPR